jgi:hypothetical protein
MKNPFAFLLLLLCQVVIAQDAPDLVPRAIFKDDPKGLKLPAAVPRMVDTNGNVVWIDHNFTTKQYQQAAFKLVLREANQVAKELELPGEYPIVESNLVEAIITPFGFNFVNNTIGSVTTKNYCYYISQGNMFSYIEGTHQTAECLSLENSFTWPKEQIDTNSAYRLAVHFLTAVSMDVRKLRRDCNVIIKPDNIYVHPPPEFFVPLYWVNWTRKGYVPNGDVANAISNDIASVLVFTPTKKLFSLRVEDPRYIGRRPLVFTNIDSLLPGRAPVIQLPPAKVAPPPSSG